jgi:hypothetical protein
MFRILLSLFVFSLLTGRSLLRRWVKEKFSENLKNHYLKGGE